MRLSLKSCWRWRMPPVDSMATKLKMTAHFSFLYLGYSLPPEHRNAHVLLFTMSS